jgi:hypothetical protein
MFSDSTQLLGFLPFREKNAENLINSQKRILQNTSSPQIAIILQPCLFTNYNQHKSPKHQLQHTKELNYLRYVMLQQLYDSLLWWIKPISSLLDCQVEIIHVPGVQVAGDTKHQLFLS